jgi:hypothetical protein
MKVENGERRRKNEGEPLLQRISFCESDERVRARVKQGLGLYGFIIWVGSKMLMGCGFVITCFLILGLVGF